MPHFSAMLSGSTLNTTLSSSLGCFTGLAFALLTRSAGWGAALDAALGTVGGLLMAWFIAPISEVAHDPDSLNIAAMIGAPLGAIALVALSKLLRGK
jgi:uncharacterized membrane protein YeaQ/YmgE (transglycosylase-associated protein family)